MGRITLADLLYENTIFGISSFGFSYWMYHSFWYAVLAFVVGYVSATIFCFIWPRKRSRT